MRAQRGRVVTGVTAPGYREILALAIGDRESPATWGDTFAGLQARGLTGVDLVVSDQHAGLVAAMAPHVPGATWPRGQTPCTRNILTAAPQAQPPALGRALRGVPTAPDRATADTLVARVPAQFTATAPQALPIWDDGLEDALAILAYPEAGRVRLRTPPWRGAAERGHAAAGAGHPHLPSRRFGPPAVGGRVAGDPRAMGDGAALPEPDELPRVVDGREPCGRSAAGGRDGGGELTPVAQGGGRFYTTFST